MTFRCRRFMVPPRMTGLFKLNKKECRLHLPPRMRENPCRDIIQPANSRCDRLAALDPTHPRISRPVKDAKPRATSKGGLMKLTTCIVFVLCLFAIHPVYSDQILKTFDIKTPFGSIDNPSGGDGV